MEKLVRINQLKEMLEKQPKDVFLTYALGLEYVALNDDENGRLTFENVIALQEDYLGVYFQLAQLYERIGEDELAIETYEKGMEVAKVQKDLKTFNELKSALEELMF
jgi:Tfp pilus assembly protein PilF